MQMDAGIDTGDILYQKELPIDRRDTSQSLYDKLTVLGGQTIVEALKLLEQGMLVPRKQREEESCYVKMITKEMGRIDFSRDALSIERLVRGMIPWPSAYTLFRGKQMKIWEAVALEGDVSGLAAGTVSAVGKEDFTVVTGRGFLQIRELQLEGKKRMSAHDFLLGMRVTPGEKLG